MTIATTKKRYSLTLTKENMEEVQRLLRETGQGQTSALISNMVDEFLMDVRDRLLILHQRKLLGENPRLVDLFEQLHKALKVVQDDQLPLKITLEQVKPEEK